MLRKVNSGIKDPNKVNSVNFSPEVNLTTKTKSIRASSYTEDIKNPSVVLIPDMVYIVCMLTLHF